MDVTRLRLGELLAGAAGLGLLLAMGLDWFGDGSAWADREVLRFPLAIVGLSGLALLLAGSLKRPIALPVAAAVFATPLGLIGVVLVALRILFGPGEGGAELGAWLGLAASFGVFMGAFLSMKDEGTGSRHAREQTERVLAIRGEPRPAPPAQAPVERGPEDPMARPAEPETDRGS